MYTALAKDYPSFKPPPNKGGLLTPWAEQGVLLLNTCLTVRAHEANSHANHGWEAFTQKVIDTVAKVRSKGVVFLAWGNPAQKRVAKVNKTKHLVLQSVHPSPLSASRGFFDCGHFKKTNNWLAERYGVDNVINWDLDKPKPIAGPGTSTPVKATDSQGTIRGDESVKAEDSQETIQGDGLGTELPERKAQVTVRSKDEFDDEEDEDAIEALEAIANSSVNDDVVDVPAGPSDEKVEIEKKDVKDVVEEVETYVDEAKKEDKPVQEVLS